MIYSLLAILSLFFSHDSKKNKAEIITPAQLQSMTIRPDNDSIYVVNFWATWCPPCVAELPFFEKAGKQFADKNVKIDLMSMDFIGDTNKVNKFIEDSDIENEVYLFPPGDPNLWINKIDTSWSGGIPATIIYKRGKNIFFREGDFATQEELDSVIQTKIK